MPAISVDTFFACSLMVLVVVSAMATSSKLLYPYLNSTNDVALSQKYERLAEEILLSTGAPSNWGQFMVPPETFGLAKAGSNYPYDLDADKISKLNNENVYALDYQQIFTKMNMPDTSFRFELTPLFEMHANLTSVFNQTNATTYQFWITPDINGKIIPTTMKYYAIATNYLQSNTTATTEGGSYLSVNLPDNIRGPALLVVLARALYDPRITSWYACEFADGSLQPETHRRLANLSPLNHTLTVTYGYPTINLTGAYELSYNYSATLEHLMSNNASAAYEIPSLLDAGVKIIAITGWNGTAPFVQYVPYPQLPVQFGATFTSTLSNVFSYSYLVLIDSGIFDCTFLFGGPTT